MGSRRNKVKHRGRFAASVIVVLLLLAAGGVAGLKMYMEDGAKPVNPTDSSYVNLLIPSGSTTQKIGELLESYDLIKDVSRFKMVARLEGYDGNLKAGEYTFSKSMSVRDMLDILSAGSANTKRFTIPEGYTVAKTADKLENEGFIDRDAFMDAADNAEFPYKFMQELPKGHGRLEGFLFPETYDVFTTATEEDIISRMLAQFDKEFTDEYYVRADELGCSLYKIITIASLIEAEARAAVDRPLIASVIYNRLSVNMKLQLDATVQYALGETKERLLIKDTQIDHPYNTYVIDGLPPGPICSPGADSIHAALYPAESNYLFYVRKPDNSGEHNFAESINEFNRYKAQWQQYQNSLD
ncbi:MAG: endolytic transglycosylase MltG [Clostridiales bacterium]|nr:endolytic transglycosylase MltG [Clostridiales bacterium]